MYFSDFFKIKRGAEDDWFDPILDTDTKLFVDPFLIFQDDHQDWAGAHDELIAHFDRCFQLIAQGNRDPKTVPYRKALALLRFPEPREFCLGYTATGTRGSGGGEAYAELIAEAMSDAIERGLQDLRHFEELGVLNEGIGPDRISDLTCNVLRQRFVSYTQAVAARHKLTTERVTMPAFNATRVAWQPVPVDLPMNPDGDRPVLLVPERFLHELPVLNADDWWENYEAEQLRNDVNYEVLRRVKKRDIVNAARRNPQRVRAWAQKKEQTKAAAYDLSTDPAGVYQWERAAQVFVGSAPLTLAPPSDEQAFIAVIELVVEQYKHFIEQEGGSKLLWDDALKKPKHEEAAQLLFRGIAKHYCIANDIVIDREVELGRGPVDFKFSNGYRRRAHLEVKKLENTKFWNGLTEQLPTYLTADECRLGWYLPIQFKDSNTARKWLKDGPALVARVAKDENLDLRTRMVDARPKPSASKLKPDGA
jgi:hypothetical protein